MSHKMWKFATLPALQEIQLHRVSKETYYFFRATLTRIHCIIINHIWTQISYRYSFPYEAHLKNQRVAFAKKKKYAMKLQKVIFLKSQKLLTENLYERPPIQKSEYSMAIHSMSMAGYVTAVLAFVHAELCGRESRSFCDFWKVSSCNFTPFSSFLTQPNVCFWDVLGKEYYS